MRFPVRDTLAAARARWYFRSAKRAGWRARVWGRPSVRNHHGTILLGDRVRIVSTLARSEFVASEGTLEIGEGAFINYGCSISASRLVRIGPGCNIGTYCILMDNDFHRVEPELRNETPESAPIVLGANVWLGARVIVLRGVTIGDGSVIGAGSVVAGDVPPRTVAAGVPARVIRQL